MLVTDVPWIFGRAAKKQVLGGKRGNNGMKNSEKDRKARAETERDNRHSEKNKFSRLFTEQRGSVSKKRQEI